MTERADPQICGHRAAAILEVFAAFVATHVCFRALKQFTVIGEWERAAGTNFTPGAVMTAFTLMVLLLCRRSFADYGFSLREWRFNLNLGVALTLIIVVVAAAVLLLTNGRYDATRPPDPQAPVQWLRIGGGALLALCVVIAALRFRRALIFSLVAMLTLLLLPQLLAYHYQRPCMWGTTLWLFFGAGFGEEIFYRGYMQPRIDYAYGQPWCIRGLRFGPGLLISAVLFGFLHVLNTVDYFHGRFDFGWWYGITSLVWGLFYGVLRASTGSIWTGAIVHGLTDVLSRVPRLL